MPKAVVLADNLAYYEKDEDGNRVRQTVAKGGTVDLSQADFDRHLRDGAIEKPGAARAEGGWPRQHDSLDELAAANDVTFSAESLKVNEKIAELEAAGVEPPADES